MSRGVRVKNVGQRKLVLGSIPTSARSVSRSMISAFRLRLKISNIISSEKRLLCKQKNIEPKINKKYVIDINNIQFKIYCFHLFYKQFRKPKNLCYQPLSLTPNWFPVAKYPSKKIRNIMSLIVSTNKQLYSNPNVQVTVNAKFISPRAIIQCLPKICPFVVDFFLLESQVK